MAGRVRVGLVSDMVDGDCAVVPVGPTQVAVWRVAGEFFALEDRCPHAGAPLSDGPLDGATVVCPWHQWCFALKDGRRAGSAKIAARPFRVTTDGGVVEVEVP